jgi:PQQ-dependent catabolism-associated CXXCW motif protein
MPRPILILMLLALVAAAPPPEPRGYWLGPIHGAVPATLKGGTVIHTEALAHLLKRRDVVLIDVAPAARRPSGMPASAPWLPPAHRAISGSVWIPDAGLGLLPAALDAFYRASLAELTGHDRTRRIVIYCHPQCWMSWNAAKRAIRYGYRRVYWYPDGVEGWMKAGHPVVAVQPEGPDAR